MAQAVALIPLRHAPWPRLTYLFAWNRPHFFSSAAPAPALSPLGPQVTDGDEEGETEAPAVKKSRNELKREASRAVRWGMELAKFSTAQIKQVLRIASVEREVFEALMLVKRLGPDVREGKRRQFNYIGRLLRNAEPELMDALIQASKDGDNGRLLALAGPEALPIGDDDVEANTHDLEVVNDSWDTGEKSGMYEEIVSRWFEGLVDKDPSISKEVYSIHNVDFDRQELRKLVRRVQSAGGVLVNGRVVANDVELTSVKKPLIRFLHILAKKTYSP